MFNKGKTSQPNNKPGRLTGEDIKSLGLIAGASEDGFRAVSYDLHVGRIIDPDGKTRASYRIPPQGIVEVIAKERVALPDDVVGHVSVKTSLCNDGLLALNIGIVDPAYQGKVSSFLVNFGKNPYMLSVGEAFLRATFERLHRASSFTKAVSKTDEEYTRERRKQVVSGFGRTFLNTEEVIDKFVEESMGRIRARFIGYVSAAAFVLAVMTFLINFGSMYVVHRWIDPGTALTDKVRRDVDTEVDTLRYEDRQLRAEVESLEADRRARDVLSNRANAAGQKK
jgi:deoxycytidine triphosphate deaminase